MSVMLYKKGGSHVLHGLNVDYVIVDENDVADHIEQGWAKSPTEAHADKPAPQQEDKPRRGRPPKVKSDDD
ncbi:MAG: hypothetical protein EP341_00835 [Sphingomonadales bacterium]|nr:MAG: hypothetical protein EP341_00835 [Sphingomonadales bacterium]